MKQEMYFKLVTGSEGALVTLCKLHKPRTHDDFYDYFVDFRRVLRRGRIRNERRCGIKKETFAGGQSL